MFNKRTGFELELQFDSYIEGHHRQHRLPICLPDIFSTCITQIGYTSSLETQLEEKPIPYHGFRNMIIIRISEDRRGKSDVINRFGYTHNSRGSSTCKQIPPS